MIVRQPVSNPVTWRCCWEWTSGHCGDGGLLDTLVVNVGGVICVCPDPTYLQLMVSSVVRGGFDREVEIWCVSLHGELVAVEVREQLVTPLSFRNVWRWTQSQESSHSFPGRANAARSISAIMATIVFWPAVLRGGSFWLSSLAVQYFVLRLRLPKEGPVGQIFALNRSFFWHSNTFQKSDMVFFIWSS